MRAPAGAVPPTDSIRPAFTVTDAGLTIRPVETSSMRAARTTTTSSCAARSGAEQERGENPAARSRHAGITYTGRLASAALAGLSLRVAHPPTRRPSHRVTRPTRSDRRARSPGAHRAPAPPLAPLGLLLLRRPRPPRRHALAPLHRAAAGDRRPRARSRGPARSPSSPWSTPAPTAPTSISATA